jgi:enoyl-CoA hydratase/carnithine racemase
MSPFRASVPLTHEWEHFRFSVAEGVGTVTLDRPDKLNALTFEAYADLRDLLAELSHRGDTRVLVVRGNGRAFCSGGDVNEIIGATLSMPPNELLAFTRMSGEVIREMRDCPVPIIAAVHGMAAGAGAVIALAADFRVCTPAARFAFLFTKVGLSGGDMGAAYLLPRLVGLGHATRLLMLGDTVSAEEAERIGLISELVSKDAFDDAVGALARRLATGPAQAYAQTKALLTREQDMSLSAAIELEAMTQALLMKGQDYAEFHAAFNAGRPPRWQGR